MAILLRRVAPAGAYAGTPAQTVILTNGKLAAASAVVLSGGARASF